jgi:hypothetical protein
MATPFVMLVRSLLFISLLADTGCHPPDGGQAPPLSQFTLPAVTQPGSVKDRKPALQRADSIVWVWPPLVGRFAFARHIALDQPDSLGDDLARQGYPSYSAFQEADSLGTDGLELVPDYPHELVYQYPGPLPALAKHYAVRVTYPVYVVNSTPHTKLLYGNSRAVFAVQEAQDRTGRWRPIESKGLLSGNSHWIIKIRPHQMAVFLLDKYAGDFATRLRVRVQNGESRYVSPSYPGRINERQFQVPQVDYQSLVEDPAGVQGLYYGAVPAAVDSIRLHEDLGVFVE